MSIQQIISTALTTGCEVTLESLIYDLNIKGMALDQLAVVSKFIAEWPLDLIPPLTTGDFATPRILRPKRYDQHTAETISLEIRQGESSVREYKSSLLYDYKRAKANPQTTIKLLKSDAVLHSSLKTIAAFLNSGGGALFVGVSDEFIPIGLREDCKILDCPDFDADIWEQSIRSHISGKFKDGKQINDYIDIIFKEVEGQQVARVQVSSKKNFLF